MRPFSTASTPTARRRSKTSRVDLDERNPDSSLSTPAGPPRRLVLGTRSAVFARSRAARPAGAARGCPRRPLARRGRARDRRAGPPPAGTAGGRAVGGARGIFRRGFTAGRQLREGVVPAARGGVDRGLGR